MSTISALQSGTGYGQAQGPLAAAEPKVNYLTDGYGWKSWLLTVDHKRIGILYLISVSAFFLIGGAAAVLIRYNLISPYGTLTPDQYNKVFTAHGVVMVFLFLVPVVPGVLGNFLVPLMVGARDLAFPRLNLLSWYLYMAGGVFATWSLLVGGVDTGWTLYPPYSATSPTNVVPVALAIFIAGFSSILTGLNIVVTVHRMRAPGMTWFRLPLFIWAIYATSIIMLLATPVLAMTVAMLAVERIFQIGIFDPKLEGDPLLFQHMFWFYSHPAVYIMILPGMGVISEVITCFSRKNIFGYKAVAWSSVGIAVIGFMVWGHHMFVAGQGYYLATVFSLLTMLVAVPSAIKVFNWTATLYRGSITFTAPMLYTLGFIAMFTVGGLTGLFLGVLGTDRHLHDTYFVIAHFHFVMVGGMVMAYFAGIHFWWPKITGRMYSDWWGRMAAMIMFVGFFLTFVPQFVLGYLGMPRRYHAYPPEFQVLNVMSSAGASILAVAYALPFFYLIHSIFYGQKAGPNPWGATGLEWQTSSPPPTHNFETMPVVVEAPYEYALPTAPRPAFIDGTRVGPDGRPYSGEGELVTSKTGETHGH
jgi:cytochrome c oxidase subunit 1